MPRGKKNTNQVAKKEKKFELKVYDLAGLTQDHVILVKTDFYVQQNELSEFAKFIESQRQKGVFGEANVMICPLDMEMALLDVDYLKRVDETE